MNSGGVLRDALSTLREHHDEIKNVSLMLVGNCTPAQKALEEGLEGIEEAIMELEEVLGIDD